MEVEKQPATYLRSKGIGYAHCRQTPGIDQNRGLERHDSIPEEQLATDRAVIGITKVGLGAAKTAVNGALKINAAQATWRLEPASQSLLEIDRYRGSQPERGPPLQTSSNLQE